MENVTIVSKCNIRRLIITVTMRQIEIQREQLGESNVPCMSGLTKKKRRIQTQT